MLSLSKEMVYFEPCSQLVLALLTFIKANDTAINLIPIKRANGCSIQEAFDDSADLISLVINRFEARAQDASLDRDSDELFVPGERARLVKGMRDMWAGNHHWQ
jgi:hypothetical protein